MHYLILSVRNLYCNNFLKIQENRENSKWFFKIADFIRYKPLSQTSCIPTITHKAPYSLNSSHKLTFQSKINTLQRKVSFFTIISLTLQAKSKLTTFGFEN